MASEQWTREQLRGDSPAEKYEDPQNWGLPGFLTEEEAIVYEKFQQEVQKRGGDFRQTIFSFGEEEGEAWALCRWLRARKFVLKDTIQMVEEATETAADAKSKDFYPDPVRWSSCS